MRVNADITLVRSDVDGKVVQSVIRGINWQEERKSTVTDKGLLSADVVAIYIPSSSVLPDIAVQKGDFAVKGIHEYTHLKGKELLRAMEKDGKVLITSVQDNRHLGARLGHIELGCV